VGTLTPIRLIAWHIGRALSVELTAVLIPIANIPVGSSRKQSEDRHPGCLRKLGCRRGPGEWPGLRVLVSVISGSSSPTWWWTLPR